MPFPKIIIMPIILLGMLHIPQANAQQKYSISMPTRNDPNCQQIYIEKMSIQTVVIGGLSTTQMEIVFFNPNKKRLEGTFEIPLAPGWQLSKFALDIDGKMRDAVTVPKAKGRQAFNAIIRRRVDPALVEHVAGNLFRARVYPFNPESTRRVIITLDHQLQHNRETDLFDFPYTFDYPIKDFSLSIRVIERQTTGAKVEGIPGLTFASRRLESVLQHDAQNLTLKERVKVHLPRQNQPSLIFAKDNEGLIYAAPAPFKKDAKPRQKPAQITILWDASHSRSKANVELEKKLLKQYIQWMENGKVELVTFNIACNDPKTFQITNGNADDLFNELEKTQIDGATNLSRIQWNQLKGDAILLFSDALTTIPGQKNGYMKNQVPLFTISSSTVKNADWLKLTAVTSGGAYIDLAELELQQAKELMTKGTTGIISWKPANGDLHVFPQQQSQKPPLWLFGTANNRFNELTVNLQTEKKEQKREKIQAQAQNVWEDKDIAGLLRRAFVHQEIARLKSQGKEKESEELAQKYHVVTENSSLIVLEEINDYVTYEIVPPPELQEQYFYLLKQRDKDSAAKAEQRMERLIKQSKAQTDWWLGKVKPERITKESSRLGRRNAMTARGNMPPTADAAPMERLESQVMNDSTVPTEKVDFLVVTSHGARAQNQMEQNAEGGGTDRQMSGSIEINAWDSQSPYLKVLEYATPGEEENTYFRLKQEYGSNPSFYLDAAEFFLKKGKKNLAFRIATNLLEVDYDAPELLRALGRLLEKMNMLTVAEGLYRELVKIAPHEPQSHRDLAHLLERKGELQEAIDLLYHVATGDWEERFNGIELIAINELNAIRMRNPKAKLNLKAIHKDLIKDEPVDVRIVLTWANDNSDVDLHVITPDNEECYYGYRLTNSLAKISNDITQGYGPEEFMHKDGRKGSYTIRAKLFADHNQTALVPKYVYVRCYLYYGTPREQVQDLAFRIENQKDIVTIGKITFE